MVENFRLTNAKHVSTPMEPGAQFSNEQSPSTPAQPMRMQGIPYAEAIGSALWPMVVSRLDAAFAVGTLSQFIQNPGQAHWEGLKRVISYLGSTKDHWSTPGRHRKILVEGFCDADWAGQRHRHSISGYLFHFGNGAVTWSSKKQYVVALSSAEAEYIAQTHAAKEALYLRTFIGEIREQFKTLSQSPVTIKARSRYLKTTNSTRAPNILIYATILFVRPWEMAKLKSNIFQRTKIRSISFRNHSQRRNSVDLQRCWVYVALEGEC